MHRRSCVIALAAISAFVTCSFADDLTIGPDDLLAVFVAEHPELSIEKAAVSRSGSLTHPVWGEVHVEGLSKSQVEAAIRDHLAADFLDDPHVTVTVLQSSQLIVWLLSPTAGTNAYRLQVNGRLSELLITAGAPTPICNSTLARITRSEKIAGDPDDPSHPQASERLVQTTVDLHDLMVLGKDGLDVPLRRNDRVQLVYRDPKIRRTVVFVVVDSEAQTCSLKTADAPPPPRLQRILPLGPDELAIAGDLPPVAGNCATVRGAVLHEGDVELAPGATLGHVVARAGLSPLAGSLSRIVLINRTGPPKASVWYMRSSDTDDGYGLHEPVRAGDVILVISDAME